MVVLNEAQIDCACHWISSVWGLASWESETVLGKINPDGESGMTL